MNWAEIELHENRSMRVVRGERTQIATSPSSEIFGSIKLICKKQGMVRLSEVNSMEARILGMNPFNITSFDINMSKDDEVCVVSRCSIEAARIDVISEEHSGKLWVVVACMGRLDHLKRTAPLFIGQKSCQYVLVDWSCPNGCGDWLQSKYPEARVVRVARQMYFNQSAARNAGASAVPDGEWICFTDANIQPHPRFCDRILARRMSGKYMRIDVPENDSAHYGGTCVVHKDDYLKAGKFDEAFKMYGYGDVDFQRGLNSVGCKLIYFPSWLASHIDHPCSNQGKDLVSALELNKKYSSIKWDLYRKRGRVMSRKQRLSLYSLARDSDHCTICRNPNSEMLSEDRAVKFKLSGGMGDKLCGISVARQFARAHPSYKVYCDIPISGWYRDGLVGYSAHGKYELWGIMHDLYIRNRNSLKFKNYYGFFLDYLGFECDGRPLEMPSLLPRDDYPSEYIVFHPLSVWAQSPPGELIEEALSILFGTGVPIVSVGNLDRRWPGVDHRFNGKSIVQACRLIANSKAIVTARSGPAHIAPAYNVPVFCWNPNDGMDWHVNYPGVWRSTYGDAGIMGYLREFLKSLGLFVK